MSEDNHPDYRDHPAHDHYGLECDGIARWVVNPYVAEIYGEEDWLYITPCVYYEMCQDI